MIPNTQALRDEVKEFGFAIIHGVISREEAAAILTMLQREKGSDRAGSRNMLGFEVVHHLANDSRLLEIARAVLGDGTSPFRATLFEKSPGANWLVSWHQDRALPMKRQREKPEWGPWSRKAGVLYALAPASAMEQVLALRIHFDDCSRDNGPLRVLPGTHKMGVLTGETIDDLVRQGSAQECLIGAGGVVVMKPLLVHSSSKSQTSGFRRVLHVEYAPNAIVDGDMELARA